MKIVLNILDFWRIYPDQLAALSGLTAFPITTQQQGGLRYITTSTPHGLTTAGQPTGAYTIGYDKILQKPTINISLMSYNMRLRTINVYL
jgi:hypothetical protein